MKTYLCHEEGTEKTHLNVDGTGVGILDQIKKRTLSTNIRSLCFLITNNMAHSFTFAAMSGLPRCTAPQTVSPNEPFLP